jgi:hypothetical protein
LARGAEAATCDGDDTILVRELRREVVEHVTRIAESSKEHQGRTPPAPIENLEPDPRSHSHKSDAVRWRKCWHRPLRGGGQRDERKKLRKH